MGDLRLYNDTGVGAVRATTRGLLSQEACRSIFTHASRCGSSPQFNAFERNEPPAVAITSAFCTPLVSHNFKRSVASSCSVASAWAPCEAATIDSNPTPERCKFGKLCDVGSFMNKSYGPTCTKFENKSSGRKAFIFGNVPLQTNTITSPPTRKRDGAAITQHIGIHLERTTEASHTMEPIAAPAIS